ncbi:MAG TPA: hypothetical protein HPP87_09695 [Planctomycetes bacterium]|nr:hypothetical protein [Planctomycetota bacterium]
MLSFMQDNNRINTGEPEGAGAEFNEDRSSAEQDYLTPAEHGKNSKRTTIILVVLFTVGALCVWFMIKKVAPRLATAAMSSEEVQIENALAQLTGIKTQVHNSIDQMLGQFYQFADFEQIGVGELKKNPFRHELYLSEIEVLLDQYQEDSSSLNGGDLQLWGILQTEQGNCCMINDKIVYEGDWIGGLKVVQITNKFVELVSTSGSQVILKMPE